MRRTHVEGLPPVGTPVWAVDTDAGASRIVEGRVRRHFVTRQTFAIESPGYWRWDEYEARDVGVGVYLRREEAELQVARVAAQAASLRARDATMVVARAEGELAQLREVLTQRQDDLAEAKLRVAELEATVAEVRR